MAAAPLPPGRTWTLAALAREARLRAAGAAPRAPEATPEEEPWFVCKRSRTAGRAGGSGGGGREHEAGGAVSGAAELETPERVGAATPSEQPVAAARDPTHAAERHASSSRGGGRDDSSNHSSSQSSAERPARHGAGAAHAAAAAAAARSGGSKRRNRSRSQSANRDSAHGDSRGSSNADGNTAAATNLFCLSVRGVPVPVLHKALLAHEALLQPHWQQFLRAASRASRIVHIPCADGVSRSILLQHLREFTQATGAYCQPCLCHVHSNSALAMATSSLHRVQLRLRSSSGGSAVVADSSLPIDLLRLTPTGYLRCPAGVAAPPRHFEARGGCCKRGLAKMKCACVWRPRESFSYSLFFVIEGEAFDYADQVLLVVVVAVALSRCRRVVVVCHPHLRRQTRVPHCCYNSTVQLTEAIANSSRGTLRCGGVLVESAHPVSSGVAEEPCPQRQQHPLPAAHPSLALSQLLLVHVRRANDVRHVLRSPQLRAASRGFPRLAERLPAQRQIACVATLAFASMEEAEQALRALSAMRQFVTWAITAAEAVAGVQCGTRCGGCMADLAAPHEPLCPHDHSWRK